ncbi:hypothetical protein B0H14DRAFT_155965 [Mycena olivaceomarginata]|nr:hypothetical protein B0H14DRAFT_155965 [Mycena olivaceomarginata]
MWSPMSQILHLMENAPKLRSLSTFITGPSLPVVRSLSLPDLVILWIGCEVDAGPLFKRLTVPSLQNINVFCANVDPPIPQTDVVHCIMRSGSILHTAIFKSLHISNSDLIDFLRHSPSLLSSRFPTKPLSLTKSWVSSRPTTRLTSAQTCESFDSSSLPSPRQTACSQIWWHLGGHIRLDCCLVLSSTFPRPTCEITQRTFDASKSLDEPRISGHGLMNQKPTSKCSSRHLGHMCTIFFFTAPTRRTIDINVIIVPVLTSITPYV